MQKVLSTITRMSGLKAWAVLAISSMSSSFSVGLQGVSKYTTRVLSVRFFLT